ncbi:MAG TPA: hypothetical protein VES68_03060 [Candidatus Sulfotelmatobacter sp.]|nr:hypothetical protein [Candidatus Sulfotelmatobacter sp.]
MEKGQRISGFRARAIEASLVMPIILAACGGDKTPATQTPLTTEKPTPTVLFSPSPEVTATPEPTPTSTPEPTPSTSHIANGTAYIDSYTQWKKDNTKSVTLSSLQSGTTNLLTSPAFKDSTNKDVKDIYDYLVTQKNLQTYFDDLAGKLQAQDQNSFMGGCVDMTKFMAVANNAGVVGALDIAFKTEAFCEANAAKYGFTATGNDSSSVRYNITTTLDTILH